MNVAETSEEQMTQALKPVARAYLTKRRAVIVMVALAVALVIACVISLALGSEYVAPQEIIAGWWAKLSGGASPLSREHEVIIFGLRLPRIALALGVGASLALSGAALQALLRNPLADPYLLGVSGGAALGSLIGLMFFGSGSAMRMLLGFAGAALVTLIIFQFGRREDDPARLILAGVIAATFLSSIIALLTAVADNVKLRNITAWLLGDLSSGTAEGITFIAVIVVVGAVVLVKQARALNLMMIGERDAFALGIETARVRWIVFVMASLLTGAAVSAGGAIGYVGLVVPHLVRLAAGADNRLVIPASAIAGALLVLLADTIARTALAPRELPTGAITALIGAPVFVYLLLKSR